MATRAGGSTGDMSLDDDYFESWDSEMDSEMDSECYCCCSDCESDADSFVSETDVNFNFLHVNPVHVKRLDNTRQSPESQSLTSQSPVAASHPSSEEPAEVALTNASSIEPVTFIPQNPRDRAVIREIYQSGTKFYDRKTLQYLADVFDAWAAAPEDNTTKAILTDLLGDKYEISNETGQDPHVPESPHTLERFKARPLVHYMTYNRMARLGFGRFGSKRSPFRVFQPMGIHYAAEWRDPDTKEVDAPPEGDLQGWTFSRFRREYRRSVKKWKKKKVFEAIKACLEQRNLRGINKVVMFGGGTMTRDYGETYTTRSFNQHGLVVLLGRLLAKYNPHATIQLFAQDPSYGGFDNQLLEDQGIKVLHDPRGFLEVDENTIVLSFYFIPTHSVLVDLTRPAVFICNSSPREHLEPRVLEMRDNEYDATAMPGDDRFAEDAEVLIRKNIGVKAKKKRSA
ncbi:hypothetical protein OQA88_3306 [Cercophora sp. LCS_1]